MDASKFFRTFDLKRMTSESVLKLVGIKTGVVKRLYKELAAYEKEVEKETVELEKLKTESSSDEFRIKKQAELLQVRFFSTLNYLNHI